MIEVLTLTATLLGQATPPSPPQAATTQRELFPYEGEWIVKVVDHITLMPETEVTLVIEGGAISGRAPCNTYRGQVTVTGEAVRVGELLRTMKACDSIRMSEERDFFAVLGAVTRLEVQRGRALVLSTAAGKTITARRREPTTPRGPAGDGLGS
jgi:heat shock protein HslJ